MTNLPDIPKLAATSNILITKAVRPASNWYPQTLPMQLARSRHPFNTRKVPLNAASFLTWHGSWISVVKDPNVNTTYTGLLHKYQPSAEHHPCYSGLQVQGAATTPAARYFNYTCYICLLSRCEALTKKDSLHNPRRSCLTHIISYILS